MNSIGSFAGWLGSRGVAWRGAWALLVLGLLGAWLLTGCRQAQESSDLSQATATGMRSAAGNPIIPTGTPRSTQPSAAAAPQTPAPVLETPTAAWHTYSRAFPGWGFELRIPPEWKARDTRIECARIYEIGPLKLIVFGACWEDEVGGKRLSFGATYRRFRDAFSAGAPTPVTTPHDIQAEVLRYTTSPAHNGVYSPAAETGTVALWQQSDRGFALLDEGNQAQDGGLFDRVLESFQFVEQAAGEGNRIAFARPIRDPGSPPGTRPICHIFVADVSGSELIDLTPDGDGCDVDPAFSPDGRRIAFIRNNAVFVMEADGSKPRQVSQGAYFITEGPIYWSKDGQRVAIYYPGDYQYHSYTLDGKTFEKIEKLSPNGWVLPDYSPDGRYRADYCPPDKQLPSITDLCLYPVGEAEEINVTNSPFELNRRILSWSPDGKRIAFSSPDNVYIVGSNGTGLAKLADGFSPSWQPLTPTPGPPTPAPTATPTAKEK